MKKAGRKIIGVVVILVALAAGVIAGIYFAGRFLPDRGTGIVIDRSQVSDDADTEIPSIQFPVYPDITISADEKHIPIILSNPEGNPCYFQFSVSVDDGESFYSSDWVEPGKNIQGVDMKQPLSAGEHVLHLQISTKSIDTQQTMNGGNVRIVLHVENSHSGNS